MQPVALSRDIHWIGVNDERTRLFEGLWLIEQEGISYNAYLIKDEKTTLIDLVKEFKIEEYFTALRRLVDPASIAYVVLNHLEPDHSGALAALQTIAPNATLLCTEKARSMLESFFGITHNIQAVTDGETISLGSHTLRFITAPMVHWPETMLTFEEQTATLFSCDAFGGYGKLEHGIFDDLYLDKSFYETQALRYYANIVASFSKPVLNAAAKLAGLSIKTVAPSHGLVWRADPDRIISLYAEWAGCAKTPHAGVTIVHGSMYGYTAQMLESVITGVREAGLQPQVHDLVNEHFSYILPSLWLNQGIIIGAPTYEGQLFPTAAELLELCFLKRYYNRTAAYYGSYGWGGGATRYLTAQLERLQWKLTASLEFPGKPTNQNLESARALGRDLARTVQRLPV